MPQGSYQVVGVTPLANQLYVVRYTAQQQIEVYDTAVFKFQQTISVPGLQYAYGLTSCAVNNCLYASNFNNSYIYRVDVSNNFSVKSWGVGAYPTGLFVNNANNVLVTCYNAHKLIEYTTQGSLVREINLQPAGITNPRWAIQLSNDQFAVSQSHRVCITDNKGAILHSYGSTTAGSANGQLNDPMSLMQLRSGCLLVADSNNNRMLMLHPASNKAQSLSLPSDGNLQYPWGFFFDELRGRLYVGEYNIYRFQVFDNVYPSEIN